MTKQEIKKVKVETVSGGGTYHLAKCPHCGKVKVLSYEITLLTVVCNMCYTKFHLDLGASNGNG